MKICPNHHHCYYCKQHHQYCVSHHHLCVQLYNELCQNMSLQCPREIQILLSNLFSHDKHINTAEKNYEIYDNALFVKLVKRVLKWIKSGQKKTFFSHSINPPSDICCMFWVGYGPYFCCNDNRNGANDNRITYCTNTRRDIYPFGFTTPAHILWPGL